MKENTVDRIKQIDEEIHKLYEQYGKEDDKDVRRDMRAKWRELIKEYETLNFYNPYRKTL